MCIYLPEGRKVRGHELHSIRHKRLNSYLLVFMILASVLGICASNPSINLPAFTSFTVEGTGNLFPILFVTIACGAVSGFHALVSSGTSSKQIKNEKNMLPVSFGAMLLECLLAVSAFVLTSLDSVARVGRLSFQELFLKASIEDDKMELWRKMLTNKYVATLITLLLAYILAKVGYKDIWPLFGSANQLLSALALIACAVYMKKTRRKGWMLWIPMIIMICVTFTALIQKIIELINQPTPGNLMQAFFAVALFILGLIIVALGLRQLADKKAVTQ